MKKLLYALLALTYFQSCQKDVVEEKSIIFPESSIHGDNVLNDKHDTFIEDTSYSFIAIIPEDKTLSITIRNFSDSLLGETVNNRNASGWLMALNSNVDWTYNTFDKINQEQTFMAFGLTTAILKMKFRNGGGQASGLIEFYENDETEPFRTKEIAWEE